MYFYNTGLYFRCHRLGISRVPLSSGKKQSKDCLYYQVHQNPHSELDTDLLQNLLPSVRGCRIYFSPNNDQLNTIIMTTLLSQAGYTMYENSIYSGGAFSYNMLKEVSKLMQYV